MRLFIKILVMALLVSIAYGLTFHNFFVTALDRPLFLSDKKETIVAIYVDWMCNCANFVDTSKYKTNLAAEPDNNDYFFIEAARPDLQWDRDHFIRNRYVRLTGQFYIDKGIPADFELGSMEDKPDHARVFKFEKIEYLIDTD